MRFLTVFMLLAAACKPDSPGRPTDGGVVQDAAQADLAGCHPAFGRSFFTNSYKQLPEGQGFDLNNDGKQDNVMGVLSSFANPAWASSIMKGNAIFLFDVGNLTGPPLTDGAMPSLAFYVGIDADNPPDATNNGSGMGQFLVPAEQFDVSCRSTALFDSVSVSGGTITARIKKLSVVAQAVGSLEFSDVIIQSTLSADYSTMSGRIGGEGTPCSLSLTPSPTGSGSMLDLMINGFNIQPDIDRDGDGLERINGDGSTIASCTDGAGQTILGRDCVCDPSIVDGFSSAFDFSEVPATIVGLSNAH